jgi:hypothetical protein
MLLRHDATSLAWLVREGIGLRDGSRADPAQGAGVANVQVFVLLPPLGHAPDQMTSRFLDLKAP